MLPKILLDGIGLDMILVLCCAVGMLHLYYRDVQERCTQIGLITTGQINAFFEMVLNKMPFEDAKLFLHQLNDFYTAGWTKIMGL